MRKRERQAGGGWGREGGVREECVDWVRKGKGGREGDGRVGKREGKEREEWMQW